MTTKGEPRGAADVHVALLRGINLGGRRLPMKALADLFADAGCADVRTYIQSGNVVFRADAKLVSRVPALVAKGIARDYGFDVPLVLRTAAELGAVVRNNPFLAAKPDPRTLHVSFLADRPSKPSVAALDPGRSPGDEFVVRGSEIYLRLPNGMARSKLTNQYFDSTLKTTSTVRNWNTVLTLLEWARGG
ncbi:MAG: DUF1697 domain-containing protein [bacterium]